MNEQTFKWATPTPVILRAREIVLANLHDRDKGPGTFGEYLAEGLRDDSPEMRIALAALTDTSSSPNPDRKLKPIPISAGKRIADTYGYDQVVIFARRVGADPDPNGEHVTTYGINKVHCRVAAMMGTRLKAFVGWPQEGASQ